MILHELEQTIIARKSADPSSSWTAQLLSKGPEKCAEKFGEEAVEALIRLLRAITQRSHLRRPMCCITFW